MSSAKSTDILDRRSKVIYPIARKKRSMFADVAGTVKVYAATFDKFGNELTTIFQKPHISLVVFSRCSNFKYCDSSSYVRIVRGLSLYLDK